MQIELTAELSDFVRQAVATGRVGDPAQAVQEALALWVDRERRRAELVAQLDAADHSLDAGDGIAITAESMASLAQAVMVRCKARLAAEQL